MRKIIENREVLEWCLDNPYWINQEYDYVSSPKPKINGVFKKDLQNDNLWSKLGIDRLVEDLSVEVSKAVKLWQRLINKLFWTDFWEDDYTEEWKNNQYEDYYWSLNLETKRQLLWVIKQAIDWNWGIEKLQSEIIKIDDVVFWKGRAKTIAITETHRAYEWWKFSPMLNLKNQGKIVQKFWLTCNDDRVRETHMEAQNEGRVDIEYIYPSLWVQTPPWWFNCRCSLLFNVI